MAYTAWTLYWGFIRGRHVHITALLLLTDIALFAFAILWTITWWQARKHRS
jgi:hypothetical protein